MLRRLYVIFGLGVILLYAVSAWYGWEFFNSGSRSALRAPVFWGGGYRGGK